MKSHSQACQDIFVLEMLNYRIDGTFVEIGAYNSHDLSNTVLLEKEYHWDGLAFEIDRSRCDQYISNRFSDCICGDATKMDFEALFKEYQFLDRIDYLQLDIEPAEQTLRALKALPLSKYRFSVITYETDLYADGPGPQKEAFEILSDYGYVRAVKNVACQGNPFEDWYVDRDWVNLDKLALITDTSDIPKEACEIVAKFDLSNRPTGV
jgi:hypothetical protein